MDYVTTPFTVLIDTREQTPWLFRDMDCERTVVRQGQRQKIRLPLAVVTDFVSMQTGDYTILGYEDQFSIERKSFGDALSTFTHGRERFERELDRMAEFDFAAVMMEFPEEKFRHLPPERKIGWKTLEGSVRAWRQRYGVHFLWCRNRFYAEILFLREVRRWWNDHAEINGQAEIKWSISEPLAPPEPEVESTDGWGPARHLDEWSEDDGNVLWWTKPVTEPPWCGTPLDSDWPDYHEWFTPVHVPADLCD